jgi:hypothetical protein
MPFDSVRFLEDFTSRVALEPTSEGSASKARSRWAMAAAWASQRISASSGSA